MSTARGARLVIIRRFARRLIGAFVVLALSAGTTPSRADTPAFDRPGIAFAPSTIPAGTVAWEQGGPDVVSDHADGVTETSYSANSRLRVGLPRSFELQVELPAFVHVDTKGDGGDGSTSGVGDLGVALKLALPSRIDRLAWAAEATVSFATGKDDIGNGTEEFSLGTTVAWNVTESQSTAFYANVDVLHGDATWTLSPNWTFPLLGPLAGYVEAGYSFGDSDGDPDDVVAGGGLTWMITAIIQLDAYVLAGLTGASTDLQAGCGASLYLD